MYERCPFCGTAGREVRSVAGRVTKEDVYFGGDWSSLGYGLWWRCLGCGADYGYIHWGVQQLIVGHKWAPSGKQDVKRCFDFWTTDTDPERRMIGAFNDRREIVRMTVEAK